MKSRRSIAIGAIVTSFLHAKSILQKILATPLTTPVADQEKVAQISPAT
jgi:hypothetical protein